MNRVCSIAVSLLITCLLTACGGNWSSGDDSYSGGNSGGGNGGSGGGSGSGSGGGGGLAYVSGVVSPSSTIEKPQQCEVVVRLMDRTKGDVVATQAVDVPKRGFPVPFQVHFVRDEIKKNREYAVEARIKIKGKVRWITRQNYPVITQGNPTYNLELIAEPTH